MASAPADTEVKQKGLSMSSSRLFTRIDDNYSFTIEDPLAIAKKWQGVLAPVRFEDSDDIDGDIHSFRTFVVPKYKPLITQIEFVRVYNDKRKEVGRGAWMLDQHGRPMVHAEHALIGLQGFGEHAPAYSKLTSSMLFMLGIPEEVFMRINALFVNNNDRYGLRLNIDN